MKQLPLLRRAVGMAKADTIRVERDIEIRANRLDDLVFLFLRERAVDQTEMRHEIAFHLFSKLCARGFVRREQFRAALGVHEETAVMLVGPSASGEANRDGCEGRRERRGFSNDLVARPVERPDQSEMRDELRRTEPPAKPFDQRREPILDRRGRKEPEVMRERH